jgi:hypothetical protein
VAELAERYTREHLPGCAPAAARAIGVNAEGSPIQNPI